MTEVPVRPVTEAESPAAHARFWRAVYLLRQCDAEAEIPELRYVLDSPPTA